MRLLPWLPLALVSALAGAVSARGRLQPKDGVLKVNGPSDIVAVVARLLVDQGDRVAAGQVLAYTDTFEVRRAGVEKLKAQIEAQEAALLAHEAELKRAESDDARKRPLARQGVLAASDLDLVTRERDVARARLNEARLAVAATRAELASAAALRDLAVVRAPFAGRVLKVHARPGEKIAADGILSLGRAGGMYAVAQVYETDVTRVRVGQKARVRSPALARELTGTVERIGLMVARLDAVATEPAARVDARIVEVEVRLDDPAAAEDLTGLEVDVLIP